MFFQQILQLFFSLIALGKVVLGRTLRRAEPLFNRQGIDELILPVLYAIGQLAVHRIQEQFKLAAQPFALFPFGLFPLVQPGDNAFFDVLGNFPRVDDADKLVNRNDGYSRMLRFFHPLLNELIQEGVEIVAAHQLAAQADSVVEHMAVRVFQQRYEAVLEEANQRLPLQVLADMVGNGFLRAALLGVVIGTLGYFIQESAEFFPAAGAAKPADKLIHKGYLIQLVLPHVGLEQFFRNDLRNAVDNLRTVAVQQLRMIGEAQGLIEQRRNGKPVGNTADEGRLNDEKQQFFPQGYVVGIPPPEDGQKAEKGQGQNSVGPLAICHTIRLLSRHT